MTFISSLSQVPGKLNMSDFHKVNSALSSMKIESPPSTGKTRSSSSGGAAPLATSEDVDQHGYAVPRDMLSGTPSQQSEYAQPIVDASRAQHQSRLKHRERREQLALQQGNFFVSLLSSLCRSSRTKFEKSKA